MRKRAAAGSLALAVVSTLAGLLLAELGARALYGKWEFEDFRAEARDLFHSAYPAQYDRELGWIPKEGYRGTKNAWDTEVTILKDGVRSNGGPAPEGAPILAVGDSFTFGDEVSDQESWPAQLEKRLGRPVINGGVFGYGLDQVVLRAERLLPLYKPKVLIVGFIPVDVMRCKLSKRQGVSKPYFIPEKGGLTLAGVPVPLPERPPEPALLSAAGYSFLLHRLMYKAFPEYWLEGAKAAQTVKAHDDGVAVGCGLLGGLSSWKKRFGLDRLIVLVQYLHPINPDEAKTADQVLACARGAEVVDLREQLEAEKKANPGRYMALYHDTHMSRLGNGVVAERLARALSGRPGRRQR